MRADTIFWHPPPMVICKGPVLSWHNRSSSFSGAEVNPWEGIFDSVIGTIANALFGLHL